MVLEGSPGDLATMVHHWYMCRAREFGKEEQGNGVNIFFFTGMVSYTARYYCTVCMFASKLQTRTVCTSEEPVSGQQDVLGACALGLAAPEVTRAELHSGKMETLAAGQAEHKTFTAWPSVVAVFFKCQRNLGPRFPIL